MDVKLGDRTVRLEKGDLGGHAWTYQGDESLWNCQVSKGTLLLLHTVLDEELKKESLADEISGRIQKLRKTAGCTSEDVIEVYVDAKTPLVDTVLKEHYARISKRVRSTVRNVTDLPAKKNPLVRNEEEVNGEKFELVLVVA